MVLDDHPAVLALRALPGVRVQQWAAGTAVGPPPSFQDVTFLLEATDADAFCRRAEDLGGEIT